jgi:2-polyprenyl-3-methyl-5-hydroxy-6-metoxy-1,4-benzoquinol methylase
MENYSKDTTERFAFGKNWNDFVAKSFCQDRLDMAKMKLLESLRLANLDGKTFLDVGCGSGIHSLAALYSGAKRVLSFDYDLSSVATSEILKKKAGNPSNWRIIQGSVLDRPFMDSLGEFDIVYSWGVLHHTGSMLESLRNVRIPLLPNGALFIALYSYTTYKNQELNGFPSPERWLEIKRRYNRAAASQKRIMEWQYVLGPKWWLPWTAALNYLRFKQKEVNYLKSRGMEIWTDVRDWLGGWPMEFANELEILDFANNELGLDIMEMFSGEGNTEFIFIPKCADNWLVELKAKRTQQRLTMPFKRVKGNAWSVALPELVHLSDGHGRQVHSNLRLFENGKMMTYAHSPRNAIECFGGGRYSHWQDTLYFSTSDNTDPNLNDKDYLISFEQ